MGRDKDDFRAFLLGEPQGIAGGNAAGFSFVVFCQHNAMAGLGVAGYSHGPAAQGGVIKTFHRGVKVIHIAVKNDPLHKLSPETIGIGF